MRMRNLAVGVAFFLSLPAIAQTPASDWLVVRRVQFAQWQAAHPGADAAIADLKTKTAALVTAAGPAVMSIQAPPVIRRVPGAITELWDDPAAPELVVIPAGDYTMGSPDSEPGRSANEGPQHRVAMNYAFAVGKYPVTKDEYSLFVAETKRPDGAACYEDAGFGWEQIPGSTWRNPGFPQSDRDPAVCVSWSDAKAYVAWLSSKTGQQYRLLSESEWEYAARAGTTTARYWGDAASRDYANYGVEEPAAIPSGFVSGHDEWLYTSPVGSFPPNGFGLYDMAGNALQWLEDCYQPSFASPTNGSARTCAAHVVRGGSWSNGSPVVRSAARSGPALNRSSSIGFRVARTL